MHMDWTKVKTWLWQAGKPAIVAMIVALLTAMGYLGLQRPEGRLAAAGTTHFGSLSLSDDLTVGDDATVGGDLTVGGATSYTGGETWTGQISAGNGLLLTGNLTQTSGSAILSSLAVTSTLSANTLSVADNITATGDIHANGLWLLGDLYTNDPAQALYYGTGSFTGTLAANTLEAGNNVTVTGDVRVYSDLYASGYAYLRDAVVAASVAVTGTATANTFEAADNVTVTNDLTVTGWLGLGGTYVAVSSTVDYTDTQTLIVVANKTIYPVTAGGPTATLSSTTSISNGFYLGQIIIITNVDTEDNSLVISNAANTVLPGAANATISMGGYIMLWWDGADWRAGG